MANSMCVSGFLFSCCCDNLCEQGISFFFIFSNGFIDLHSFSLHSLVEAFKRLLISVFLR